MKLNSEIKQLFRLFIAVCLAICFFFVLKNIVIVKAWLYNLLSIINPFIYGFVIAYLLNRPMQYIENQLEKYLYKGKLKHAIKRALSIIIIFLISTAAIFLVGSFVIPQLTQSISLLATNIPKYIFSLQNNANEIIEKFGLSSYISTSLENLFSSWQNISSYIAEWLTQFVPYMVNLSMSITSKIFNIILSIAVSVYLLSDKEKLFRQLKTLMNALFSNKFVEKSYDIAHIINDTFGQYISGQMLDAIIVGTICSVSMFIFKMPFALLVGVIVCLTNVIPMLGPFIGAVPSTFIILMVDPIKALWFILLIFVLQQIDGNILVPRIVGDSTGLSGLWVLFAIVVGGGLFGILGVVLSVPTLSVIFKLLRIFISKRISEKQESGQLQ